VLAKIKIGLFVILGLLALVVVFQNLGEVEAHLLLTTLKMRLATLIAVTLLVGFVMGLIANTLWKVHSWRQKSKKKSASVKPVEKEPQMKS